MTAAVIRLFKHYVSYAVLLLAGLDLFLLLATAEVAWVVRARQIGMGIEPLVARWPQALIFALIVQTSMIAVGVYSAEALLSRRFALLRQMTAVSMAVLFLAILYLIVPDVALWRSNLAYAMPLAILLPILGRFIAARVVDPVTLRRRILVLGAGERAQRIGELGESRVANFVVARYVRMSDREQVVAGAVDRDAIANLSDCVTELDVTEVVLAIEERRGALPLADLLRLKTTGVGVNEISSFLERETGRVDLATVNPSWFIFSDGFTAGQRVSKLVKRLFDIIVSVVLLIAMSPVVAAAALAIRFDSKGPIFYRQNRVGLYGVPYRITKLRSMRSDAEAAGKAIWAAERDPRITRVGQFLRKTRIDEIPQAWNVLKGEMSFVGPRPERPEFVAELEEAIPFYAERHMVKPGLTGWAQINYPYGASIEDASAKLEYDLYYAKNYTPFLDIVILLQTVRVVLWPEGAR